MKDLLKNKKIVLIIVIILLIIILIVSYYFFSSRKQSQKNTINEQEMAKTEENYINEPINKLVKKLPYHGNNFEINYFTTTDTNKTAFSIIIYSDPVKSKQEALDWIKKRGVDPEKLDIVYVDKTQATPAQQESEKYYQKLNKQQNEYIPSPK